MREVMYMLDAKLSLKVFSEVDQSLLKAAKVIIRGRQERITCAVYSQYCSWEGDRNKHSIDKKIKEESEVV